jgi:hypothetical protein
MTIGGPASGDNLFPFPLLGAQTTVGAAITPVPGNTGFTIPVGGDYMVQYQVYIITGDTASTGFFTVGLVNSGSPFEGSVMNVNLDGYSTNSSIISLGGGEVIGLANLTTGGPSGSDGHILFGDPASQVGAAPLGVGASITFQLVGPSL